MSRIFFKYTLWNEYIGWQIWIPQKSITLAITI